MIYSLDEIRCRIIPVAKAYGICRVYLFGSYARNEATEQSDIDLLIDTSGTALRSLFSLGQLYCDLEKALKKKIDLITYGSMSREIIWETAVMDIPVLLEFCEEQLKEE